MRSRPAAPCEANGLAPIKTRTLAHSPIPNQVSRGSRQKSRGTRRRVCQEQERVIVPRRFQQPAPPTAKDGPRVNEEIFARTILLIGDDGHKYGPIGTEDARAIAEEKGFDLVEVSPDAKPPVVKLMDYGKYKYEQQKKANEARK